MEVSSELLNLILRMGLQLRGCHEDVQPREEKDSVALIVEIFQYQKEVYRKKM